MYTQCPYGYPGSSPPIGNQLFPWLGSMVPPGLIEQFIAMGQNLSAANLENVQLRYQLQQKNLAEEAYTKSLQIDGSRICTPTRHGVWVEILNCIVEWATLVKPQPPLRAKPYYVIKLSRSEQLISLTEEEYLKDSAFINKLRSIPGVEVTVRKSQKNTADLLRAAISRKMMEMTASIYCGWSEQANGKYCFTPPSSYGKSISHETGMLQATPPAVTALAIQNWQTAFSLVSSPFESWFLSVYFHVAFLFSLLDKLGHRPPLGLYVYCDNPVGTAYLRRLFCWYGNKVLTVDMSRVDFDDEALRRKDQPLLIEDAGRTGNAMKNVSTVEEMLATGSLTWRNGRDTQSLPVQALPIVLTAAVTGLACDPHLLTLELPENQLQSNRFPCDFPSEEHLKEYLAALANYTAEYTEELRTALDTAYKEEAWILAGGKLTEDYVEMLGIMLGLSRFLDRFYGSAGSVTGSQIEQHMARLLAMLDETCNKIELSYSLAEQFIFVARSAIQHGQLEIRPLSKREAAPKGTGSGLL